jgi:CBS domain containing-hemolysin-like protein
MEIEIIVAVLLLLVLGFVATVDAAFSRISDVGLRRISSEDDSAETSNSVKFLREILDNRPRFRFALSSAIQVLLIAFAVLVTVAVSRYPLSRLEFLGVALAVALVATVIFRQIVPRLLARNNTEKKLLFLLPAIRPIYAATSFFAEAVVRDRHAKAREKIEATLAPNLSDDRDDEGSATEDFQALMEVGEAEGIIEEEQREMIETFVEFSDTRAREIMTPRTDICALSAAATIRDARDLIIEEKYSRIPVYRESIDDIVGVIYVRDLMQAWAAGREDDLVETIVRDALFVPETKTAAELLKDMQLNHVQVAIVIDEYGGVAGLITSEDILEEIVGEIEDEDTEEEEVIEIVEGGEGYYDVIGSTEIFKIERLFDADLEDEDYTTIAGLVTTEAGYVPKVGEKLELRGLSIEVLRADGKKIHLLRLRKHEPTDANADTDV